MYFNMVTFSHKHIHTSYTPLKQKTGCVFRGLQKLQGILSQMRQLLHASNMSLPHAYFHTGWMWTSPPVKQPLTRTDDRGCSAGMCTIFINVLLKRKKKKRPTKVLQGVVGDTNSGWHFKWQGSCLRAGMLALVSAQLHFWQSEQEPERDDDRQTASRWYHHLPICLCIPRDIGHACVTAVYSLSARDSRLIQTGWD